MELFTTSSKGKIYECLDYTAGEKYELTNEIRFEGTRYPRRACGKGKRDTRVETKLMKKEKKNFTPTKPTI